MNAAPKYGVQIMTEERCKICTNPHRAEIEDFYTMGKRGHVLPTGVLPRPSWIQKEAPARWGITINASNLQGHFKRHFRPGDPSKSIAVQNPATPEDVEDLKTALQSGDLDKVTPEDYLETVIGIGYKDLLQHPERVTHGLVIKAIDALTRRHHDETQAKLMQALGQGVQKALEQRVPAEPVIEAQAVEVEDVTPITNETDGDTDGAGT